MRRHLARATAALVLLVIVIGGSPAAATPTFHECQKPVKTGVEVYSLRGVGRAQACQVALELFAWENAGHWSVLYGCHRSSPSAPGDPYLRLHHFHGWQLSLQGHPYGQFRMARNGRSFLVTGTDFPLNCS